MLAAVKCLKYSFCNFDLCDSTNAKCQKIMAKTKFFEVINLNLQHFKIHCNISDNEISMKLTIIFHESLSLVLDAIQKHQKDDF